MGHLVQDDICAPVVILIRYFAAEYKIILGKSHATSVFHCTCIKFCDGELVIFFKWISKSKFTLEIFKALFGDVKDFAGIEMFGKRLTAIDAKRNFFLTFIQIKFFVVRPGN